MTTEPTIDLSRIVSLADFEAIAAEVMEPAAFGYVAGGSWDEITLAENVEAWRRYRLRPRVLRDVRSIDVLGSFLGRPAALPVGIAPMAVQELAHPDGELAMAAGAAAAGIPYCLSTTSTRTVEEVAAAIPGAEWWFQLYLVSDLGFTRSLVERAAAAGARAIVLTVDLPVLAYRERDRRSGFELPQLANLVEAGGAARGRYRDIEAQRAFGLTWAELETIRGWSDLPLVLKGILTAEDARLAVEAGAAAIVVSNHGARQLDRAPATVHVLEEVATALGGRAEVWVDGGVRRGLDILTARALGATGVLIGRPFFWALAAGGQAGVERAAAILREELELALPLLGVGSPGEIDRSYVQ
jgi:4-hydroxymandelate oxidase